MSHESTAPTLPAPSQPPRVAGGGEAYWEYTKNAAEIAALRQQMERRQGRNERHTIGRDDTLLEGVYEGAYGGEAIVIDYDADPTLINQAVEKVVGIAQNPQTGKVDKNKILRGVFDVVSSTMRYDSAAVDKIFDNTLQGKDGRKISLSYYINEGVGECRHQALFAGAVLERLKDAGYIRGKASVDRNMVRHDRRTCRRRHS